MAQNNLGQHVEGQHDLVMRHRGGGPVAVSKAVSPKFNVKFVGQADTTVKSLMGFGYSVKLDRDDTLRVVRRVISIG